MIISAVAWASPAQRALGPLVTLKCEVQSEELVCTDVQSEEQSFSYAFNMDFKQGAMSQPGQGPLARPTPATPGSRAQIKRGTHFAQDHRDSANFGVQAEALAQSPTPRKDMLPTQPLLSGGK